MNAGEIIREKRLEKGLTQGALSALVCVGRTTINSYESGKIQPSVESAKEIGTALGIPWYTLFSEVDG